MANRTLLVIGATGDVGQGIARSACENGWSVIGAARNEAKLQDLATCMASAYPGAFHPLVGDVSTQAGAQELWHAAIAATGSMDAVIVSINALNRSCRLMDWTLEDLAGLFQTNLLSHFNVAKAMVPLLPDHGMLIGIGGGTADFIIPNMAPLSMVQAALRMLYRGLVREHEHGAVVRELMIASMVNGASKRDDAQAEWLTDQEIGRHVCAILARPQDYPDPVIEIARHSQVGRPASPKHQR